MRWAALLLLTIVSAGAGDEWERVGNVDGILVERHVTEDAPLRELRVSAHSPVPPAQLMATIWKHDEYEQFVPFLIHLDVLRDDGDAKLLYEQIQVPFAKDRDMVVRLRRTSADGIYEVISTAVPDEGPRATDKFVRVRTSRARWRLAPATDGGTDVTYTLATDAGGRLPGWVLSAIQKDAATKLMRAMLDRAARAK